MKSNGVLSDHAALMTSLRFPSTNWIPKKHHDRTMRKGFKINNRILCNTENKAFKSKIVKYINSIDNNQIEDTSNLSPSEALSKFEVHIVKPAEEIAEEEVKTGSLKPKNF